MYIWNIFRGCAYFFLIWYSFLNRANVIGSPFKSRYTTRKCKIAKIEKTHIFCFHFRVSPVLAARVTVIVRAGSLPLSEGNKWTFLLRSDTAKRLRGRAHYLCWAGSWAPRVRASPKSQHFLELFNKISFTSSRDLTLHTTHYTPPSGLFMKYAVAISINCYLRYTSWPQVRASSDNIPHFTNN